MLSNLITTFQVGLVNILLSGDVALVIAIVYLGFPPNQRVWGSASAVCISVVPLVVLVELAPTAMVTLWLMPIGALVLFYAAIKGLIQDADENEVKGIKHFLRATLIVAVAGTVLSLDSSVIVLSAITNGAIWPLILGLSASIPAIAILVLCLTAAGDRYPVMIWAGAAFLGWIAADLISLHPSVQIFLGYYGDEARRGFTLCGAILVLVAGLLWRHPHRPLVDDIWPGWNKLKQAGFALHRQRVFSSRFHSTEKQQTRARELDDASLLWAFFLPDHEVGAKNVIVQELERRGRSQQQIRSWSPDASELAVPTAISRIVAMTHYSMLIRNEARTFQIYRIVAVVAGLALIAVVLVTPFEVSSVAYVLPFVVFFGAIEGTVGILFQDRALRILLLRPFGEKKMTAALKQFVCRNLGRAGFVFTLSDRNYKPSRLLWFLSAVDVATGVVGLYVLGPILRQSFRITSVIKEKRFWKLERLLISNHLNLRGWSFLSGGQAFNIRCTDSWWQPCILMLMHSCEIIVVDLSKVGAGTAWELAQLRERGVLLKCVFIINEDSRPELPAILEKHFTSENWPKVYCYRSDGKLSAEHTDGFNFALIQLMEAGLLSWGNQTKGDLPQELASKTLSEKKRDAIGSVDI